MHDRETLYGSVERIIYQNKDNGFIVFVLLAKQQNITVNGYFSAITAGEEVSLEGSWNMHQKFGKQFTAVSCQKTVPTSLVGLKKYLGSGLIKGIGPTYAEKLVNHFKEDVLTIIDTHPEKLYQVPGIGKKRIEKIINAWQEQKDISHIMVFLQGKGLSAALAIKIYKFYKQNAIDIIEENPYRLAQDIWGIGFKIADTIAQKSGFTLTSDKRITAAIMHTIESVSQEGHLYIELQELRNSVCKLLELELSTIESVIKKSLHLLYDQAKIKLITYQDTHYITTPAFYFSEKGVEEQLKKLLTQPLKHRLEKPAIQALLKTASEKMNIHLNEQQTEGIYACLSEKITIITGGPGTGKTTLIKNLLYICDKSNISYSLAAPTGRAAKRITESTARPAHTIHKLLEFDVSTMKFNKNEHNKLSLDALIVDEASMIDIFLAHSLLKSLPPYSILILLGDTDQLPSVGAGNFLHDVIESKLFATVKLEFIFRQSLNSLITVNAHRINQGHHITTDQPNSRHDFISIKETDPENIQSHLAIIYNNILPRYHIKPSDSIVLTPMHKGIAGTQKINYDLQLMLNKTDSKEYLSYAGNRFYPHDRVMQLKNNYDKNVFNGDIGTIESVNTADELLSIRFFDRLVEYDISDLNELTHAYAISIHKSQGSEFGAVIIPLFMQHFMMLQRNLLYTAVTRAKKLCILIGEPKAVSISIKNKKNNNRITFLRHYLCSLDIQER